MLSRHSWAIGLRESGRSMGQLQMRYLDKILGITRSAGFLGRRRLPRLLAARLLRVWTRGGGDQPLAQSAETAASAGHGLEPDIGVDDPERSSAFSFDGESPNGLELILTALEHKRRLDRA